MENNRVDIVVIFAGYTKEMQEFIAQNPGLKSRIVFMVDFSDYRTDEFVETAKMMIESKGYTVSDEVFKHIAQLCKEEKAETNFGKGRYVRNLVEEAILTHIQVIFCGDRMNDSESVYRELRVEDFRKQKTKASIQLKCRNKKGQLS